jgi:methyl-accepting chemotaxis protein
MLRKSLRVQILTLLGGSLAAMLLIALVCFQFLSSSVRGYAELVDGPLQASQLIDEANLQFKIQVQEWKNVLLRGRQPAELDKYWQQFQAREQQVQQLLGQLIDSSDARLKARCSSCATATASWARPMRRAARPSLPQAATRWPATGRSRAWTAPPASR